MPPVISADGLAPGHVIAGRYELVRLLGAGAMGAVWEAKHLAMGSSVALKVLYGDAAADEGLRGRFEREARVVGSLSSPYVVKAFDFGLDHGVAFMVMEHLVGEDLGVRLRRVGRLPAADVVRIVSELCEGLAHAHGKGLVHRDLKPRNVFLAQVDDREMVKILDFGIVKVNRLDATSRTRTGDVLGTPQYMSPEQVAGSRDVDLRADLWALGVLAYRSLLGRLPFEGETVADLVVSIITAPIPVPSQLDATVPVGFDAWFARACTRDPAGRFGSARELAEALRLALDEGPFDERSRASSPSRQTPAPSLAPVRDDELPTRVLEPAPPRGTPTQAVELSSAPRSSSLPWLAVALGATLLGAVVAALVFFSRGERRGEHAAQPPSDAPASSSLSAPPATGSATAAASATTAPSAAPTGDVKHASTASSPSPRASSAPRGGSSVAPATPTAAPTTSPPTPSSKDEWGF